MENIETMKNNRKNRKLADIRLKNSIANRLINDSNILSFKLKTKNQVSDVWIKPIMVPEKISINIGLDSSGCVI